MFLIDSISPTFPPCFFLYFYFNFLKYIFIYFVFSLVSSLYKWVGQRWRLFQSSLFIVVPPFPSLAHTVSLRTELMGKGSSNSSSSSSSFNSSKRKARSKTSASSFSGTDLRLALGFSAPHHGDFSRYTFHGMQIHF